MKCDSYQQCRSNTELRFLQKVANDTICPESIIFHLTKFLISWKYFPLSLDNLYSEACLAYWARILWAAKSMSEQNTCVLPRLLFFCSCNFRWVLSLTNSWTCHCDNHKNGFILWLLCCLLALWLFGRAISTIPTLFTMRSSMPIKLILEFEHLHAPTTHLFNDYYVHCLRCGAI